MIKLAFFVVRRADLSHDQFKAHALNVHVPLLVRLPGLKKFVLNLREPFQAPGQLEIDAMPELWFDSIEEFGRALNASPEGAAVLSDRSTFVDETKSKWVVLHETFVI